MCLKIRSITYNITIVRKKESIVLKVISEIKGKENTRMMIEYDLKL